MAQKMKTIQLMAAAQLALAGAVACVAMKSLATDVVVGEKKGEVAANGAIDNGDADAGAAEAVFVADGGITVMRTPTFKPPSKFIPFDDGKYSDIASDPSALSFLRDQDTENAIQFSGFILSASPPSQYPVQGEGNMQAVIGGGGGTGGGALPKMHWAQKVGKAAAEMITPAGDPVGDPVEGGDGSGVVPDGANEFTYTEGIPGRLMLQLKARVDNYSDLPPDIQSSIRFEVTEIGNSSLAWDSGNTGGKPTVNGNILEATVIFTGLPEKYSDFGRKQVRIMQGSIELAKSTCEVFYPANGKNNPGKDKKIPNWFYYYKQNIGGGEFKYDPTPGARAHSISAGGDSSVYMADYVHSPGGDYTITKIVNGQLRAVGVSETNKYYAHFCGVLAHERQHANNQTRWAFLDSDRDRISNEFERNTSHTDPKDKFSASKNTDPAIGVEGQEDSEIYAGGPVEEAGVKNANTSNDWANPGTNHQE